MGQRWNDIGVARKGRGGGDEAKGRGRGEGGKVASTSQHPTRPPV